MFRFFFAHRPSCEYPNLHSKTSLIDTEANLDEDADAPFLRDSTRGEKTQCYDQQFPRSSQKRPF